ncbi:MAG: Coenzyme F420 hydrogenase/dehydrogenase, beta subunit C-terminal domain [Clostridia bacterium]|nr:Coenzyme F420 hydrogenase/dehydrogenase, beta subunit C-terminal domain [Clostridia bacterium]
MIKITQKGQCSGCFACYNKCPVNAISMLEDNEGFKYPIVNKDKCIKCGLCVKCCPQINDFENNERFEPTIYAAWSLDEKNREDSSSGGIFSEIAKVIIQKEGAVVGAGYDNEFNVVHKIIYNIDELPMLKGSKYVQSNIKDIFKKVKSILDDNRYLLFVGTPCQVAGLYAYLDNKNYEKLITADLICHGVPSPKVYRMYLNTIKEKFNSQVQDIRFRNKKDGWKKHSIEIKFKDNSTYFKNAKNDAFMKGFLSNIYLRSSCHSCKFATIPRVADITLGDYWGIGNTNPQLDNDKGTSEILVNSSKGKEIITEIYKYTEFHLTSVELGLKANPCIYSSVKPNESREKFFKDIDSLNFNELEKKYFADPKFFVKLVRKINIELFKVKNKIKLSMKK